MSDLATSRRAMLGIMAATPMLAAKPALGASSQWQAALTAFRSAEAARDAYDRDYLTPAGERYNAIRDKWPMSYDFKSDPAAQAELDAIDVDYDPAEKRFEVLHDATWSAFETMIAIPAPDVAAVRDKMAASIDREVWNCDCGEEAFEAILADLQRLAMGGLN